MKRLISTVSLLLSLSSCGTATMVTAAENPPSKDFDMYSNTDLGNTDSVYTLCDHKYHVEYIVVHSGHHTASGDTYSITPRLFDSDSGLHSPVMVHCV